MKPIILQGLVVFIWGLQTDLLWFALPMAIIVETKHLSNRRWALTKKDFYRIADLTTIVLLGMIAVVVGKNVLGKSVYGIRIFHNHHPE